MRYLPLFGEQVFQSEIDFEWTLQGDMGRIGAIKMPKLCEVKLAGGTEQQSLTGIQLVYTNEI